MQAVASNFVTLHYDETSNDSSDKTEVAAKRIQRVFRGWKDRNVTQLNTLTRVWKKPLA